MRATITIDLGTTGLDAGDALTAAGRWLIEQGKRVYDSDDPEDLPRHHVMTQDHPQRSVTIGDWKVEP